jgi:hypothetical protein
MFLAIRGQLVKKCPTCQKNFVKNKGASCLKSCSEKKLEETHRKALAKIVSDCLPKEKITIECPVNLSASQLKRKGWGWTNDIAKIITIPWYTLRSKREFFDTVTHEIAHLLAYQVKFTLATRKVLTKFWHLKQEYRLSPSLNNQEKVAIYYQQHQKEIEFYLTESEKDEGGHWYQDWYLEYKKLFQKLLKSPYAKYAYGNIKPQDYFLKKD